MLSKYNNVPYKFNGQSIEEGLDCMTLVSAVAKDRGHHIPNVNHSFKNIANYKDLMETESTNKDWQKVDRREDTMIVFRDEFGIISHVGYMIDRYNFIHIRQNEKVRINSISDPEWKHRIEGYYIYNGDINECNT